MFTPIGKKKILLQLKLGAPKERILADDQESSISTKITQLTDQKEQNKKQSFISVASKTNLEEALSDIGKTGLMANKLMESTIRYKPETDADILKAFQSKNIEYNRFRQLLQSIFWITFDESEFKAFIEFFDSSSVGFIDGFDFMIAFIKLNTIRKDQKNTLVREKQDAIEEKKKADEENKKLLLNKKLDLAVDFDFTIEQQTNAFKKLQEAAIKFDPNHPASPNLDCFAILSMKASVFREMTKRVLNLKFDKKELGSIIQNFLLDSENTENFEVKSEKFIRYFLKEGFDGREKEKIGQRLKQKQFQEKTKEDEIKLQLEINSKKAFQIDYKYTEKDELAVIEKLRIASTKYDKTSPGCAALDGFECESLNANDFKDLIQRIFNLHLLPTELGCLIKK